MKYDEFGQPLTTEEELFEFLHLVPSLKLENFQVEDPHTFNNATRALFLDYPLLHKYHRSHLDLGKFDQKNQSNWHMPDEYKEFDVKNFCLSLCTTVDEKERVEAEYVKYEEFNLIDLLRFLKYMIDTFRKNNVVWGVGRGSSVASYILFLLGVHKIDSLKFDIPMGEFLK